ncbi:MAG: hypothetical protein KIC88_05115 [Acinetobacter sp.]|nr:hypothetical protein [Acinetobacter sp.]
MKINTNLSSIIVQSSLKTSTNGLNQAIERMTTGFKINHAKDNAANYSISTKLSSKISGYQIAEDNALMGLDLVQTASSSLETMSNLTSRLRSLATQAQNGTYGYKSIDAINSEARSIVQELNRIKQTTEYNGINLLSSSGESVASSGQFIEEIIRRDTSGMTTLASVDETTSLTSGTYSISSAEELAKLAAMTDNGLIGENTEFVLANDIDLSVYSTGEGWTPIGSPSKKFTATFDGNGHVVSNLYIYRPNDNNQGLFGWASNADIKNVGLENVDVTGDCNVGGLVGNGSNSIISNCYATGDVVGGGWVGGLVGEGSSSTISNCYATGSVTGTRTYSYVGGLVGYGQNRIIISSSYSTGSVTGNNNVGGLLGWSNYGTINNSYSTGTVTGNANVGGLLGYGGVTLDNAYYTDTTGQTNGIGSGTPSSGTAQLVTMDGLHELISQGILPDYKSKTVDKGSSKTYSLQIGINSDSSSQISFELSGIDISALDGLDLEEANALSTIDEVLKSINAEQTKLGALENRLESALEQIGVSYDNLVSTQSTIRDADIAEESSAYIRNQILQQAAATLMTTANQTPAIALQLL